MAKFKSEIGRRKRAEVYAQARNTLPPVVTMVLGNGGKNPDGSPKLIPNGTTGLFNPIKTAREISIFKIDDYTYNYMARLVIEPNEDADLLGIDVNEIALLDSEGDMIYMETFSLFANEGFAMGTKANLNIYISQE